MHKIQKKIPLQSKDSLFAKIHINHLLQLHISCIMTEFVIQCINEGRKHLEQKSSDGNFGNNFFFARVSQDLKRNIHYNNYLYVWAKIVCYKSRLSTIFCGSAIA